MASFKISGHTGLLHRWALGPSVQQTWRRIAASIGQGPVGAADLATHRLFVATCAYNFLSYFSRSVTRRMLDKFSSEALSATWACATNSEEETEIAS